MKYDVLCSARGYGANSLTLFFLLRLSLCFTDDLVGLGSEALVQTTVSGQSPVPFVSLCACVCELLTPHTHTHTQSLPDRVCLAFSSPPHILPRLSNAHIV